MKKALEGKAADAKTPVGRAHALWTLRGLNQLDDALVVAALHDRDPGVQAQALRLAEDRLASEKVRTSVLELVDNANYSVRFQLAFTLGGSDAPEAVTTLARLIRRDGGDSWMQAAILSSSAKSAPGLLETLVRDGDYLKKAGAGELALLTRLAALIGARPGDADLALALSLLGEAKEGGEAWRVAVLEGLGQGMQNSQRSLRGLWEQPPAALKEAVGKARPFFTGAATTAADTKKTEAERLAAVRLLGHGPNAVAGPALQPLLTPRHSAELQLAAVRALALQDNAKVADMLLEGWTGYSPLVRREVIEALYARKDRITKLLDAVEQKKVLAGQIETARRDQLRKHPDTDLRKRAVSLRRASVEPSRRRSSTTIAPHSTSTPRRRRADVFKRVCSTCHKLENVGTEVGPDLLSALRSKTPEVLIVDILDPSRDVDPRYINYVVTTKAGRSLTGLIAVETPASVTLRRAEKAEDTILRTQIDEIAATGKSVMPEELEKQLTKQDLADLIAYLTSVAAPPK